MRRLNDSLKQAVEHNLKAIAVSKESPQDAELLQRLNDSIKSAVKDNLAAVERIKAGFDPAQARVPEGQSTGGRWTGPGGGSGGSSSGGAGSRSRPSRQLLPLRRTQLLPVRRSAGLGGGAVGSPSKPSAWQELFGVKPAYAVRMPNEDEIGVLEGRPGVPGGFGGPGGRGGGAAAGYNSD
jgi:hypothetical protein